MPCCLTGAYNHLHKRMQFDQACHLVSVGLMCTAMRMIKDLKRMKEDLKGVCEMLLQHSTSLSLLYLFYLACLRAEKGQASRLQDEGITTLKDN